MKAREILSKADHTQLSQNAGWIEIRLLCDQAAAFDVASICIPCSYVKDAVRYLASIGSTVPVGTVIGFPNGYSTTAVKVFETQDAISNGASDIDMVINIGWVKDKRFDDVFAEIKAIREACIGHTLKVIIETCFLTDAEKIKMCEIVTAAGADYIKTSTGFGSKGATFEDVELFRSYIGPDVKIKAAGGISSLDDAKRFIELGASRLGTSRVVKICIEKGLSPDSEI